MTAARKPLACPQCSAELSLEMLFAHQEDCDAVDALIALTVPVGAQLLRYVGLFAPASSRMSTARKIKLLGELLPDLQRGVINRRNRDWSASTPAWVAAIDQILIQVAGGKLTLPLTGHGYLYEILAGIADKVEAAAERQSGLEARQRGAAAKGQVTVKGEAMSIGQGLHTVYGGRDPTLAKLDEEQTKTSRLPESVRAYRANVKKGL